MRSIFPLFVFFCILKLNVSCQETFTLIPLGSAGGYYDHELTAYILLDNAAGTGVLLDGGSLFPGLEAAAEKGNIPCKNTGESIHAFYTQHIPAVLISHPHMDHIAGFAVFSADDTKKWILGSNFTLEALRTHIFNWVIWPDMTDQGDGLCLGKYHLQPLPFDSVFPIPETNMNVEAFPLSHGNGGYSSTAFLISKGTEYFLYLGDTGADRLEGCNFLDAIWQRCGPLIKNGALKAIVIECSYPKVQPENMLFGHLNSTLLLEELEKLAGYTDAENLTTALQEVTLLINHIKPVKGNYQSIKKIIENEINQTRLSLRVRFPEQGKAYSF
ncbi:MAG: 3',5'-cyclic-nucleotide phosphodiesterase [Bacteroidia bacterium]|nr:3',5'-cyclic-nucleotide phosphodiesterase [Bacteroidales bacterium]NCD40723.1 3',5'-cyclic-nucleotide phosphodiesterase [Bacteroidia bacterium]MDD2323173.1 3',5'-cyclic-nucleotide phosphodiesterase [Bacteroidales bacterium]MDD3010320.1 3',5'-cyclic-nucleotide phosphodiesterase [Bacteroidales bacterium]MDD3961205.1 3',5'-cyclic-nucleotide phosphodiesterase [Bacteroidales bacterium]